MLRVGGLVAAAAKDGVAEPADHFVGALVFRSKLFALAIVGDDTIRSVGVLRKIGFAVEASGEWLLFNWSSNCAGELEKRGAVGRERALGRRETGRGREGFLSRTLAG